MCALLAIGCGGRKATRASDAGAEGGRDDSDGLAPDPDLCGDGVVDPGEACDDGNDAQGDGCDACTLEASSGCVGDGCQSCGDGQLDSGEQCDDGNLRTGDGCSARCARESGGWRCPVAGFECELCGDGVLQANERCDEGSFADGVGCAEDCQRVEAHFSCAKPGEECAACGDGKVSGKEVCDDGNTLSNDGCVYNCMALEPGWVCSASGGGCTLCGDGVVSTLEECDDGNFRAGDGCSARCQLEAGAVCLKAGIQCALCGNGFIEPVAINNHGSADPSDDEYVFEQCDDGNQTPLDGCSEACLKDPSFECPLPNLACNKCGDGAVQGVERCDDRNQTGGDGCAANCLSVEAGYHCLTPGVSCVRCGDGVRQTGEACDDGVDPTLHVTVGGDGCSRDCMQVEAGYRCVESAAGLSTCGKCGNGKLELDEQCDDLNVRAGDGCGASCLVEAGFNCFYPGYACVACGNGQVEPGEECDEGNHKTAGCDNCRVVSPWLCPAPGQACQLCGDGQIGTLESCDDGNVSSADGCSSTCEIEPGYECSTGTCLAAACGDGARAGSEQCDDGNTLSGDGCSTVCAVERGWVCSGLTCHRTVCGDTVVEGDEQCDDGNAATPGCDADCQLEPNYTCAPGGACVPTVCGDGFVEGSEQCDDGNASSPGCSASCRFEPGYVCVSTLRECHGGSSAGAECATDLGCPGGSCAFVDQTCRATSCGDGVVEGTEACDDHGALGVCRGGTADGASCSSGASCTGGGVCVDGCNASCQVEPFYECSGAPSVCKPILEFVAVRRFNISNVSPDGLAYDPLRRSFAGHKQVSSQQAIELCLDGAVIDPNDTAAGPYGTIYRADGTTQAISASYVAPPRPVTDGSLLEAAYDPFTGRTLFLSKQGGVVRLSEVSLCTGGTCPADSFQIGVSNIANYTVALTGVNGAEGLTVGEDGDLYVTDDVAKAVRVFARRRTGAGAIVMPNCAVTPEANCTSFSASPTVARGFSAASVDVLDAIFTVPGEEMVGTFNEYVGAASYLGMDVTAAGTYSTSEYFSFYQPSLGTTPPLYGRSQLPGLLFDLGEVGRSYVKYAQSAETASDGGSFVICPQNPSEDCQLFARVCKSDADCTAVVPGTRCMLNAPVPYCSSPGDARDDFTKVARSSTNNVLDVLANDSRSESSCLDPVKRVINVTGRGATGSSATSTYGGTVTVSNAGANVTYSAPAGQCGFIDSFIYTANLGGGVTDSATVRVLIQCVCGDGVLDPAEQCDLGGANGPLPSRCSASCTINVKCGDHLRDPGEACDDGNTTSGDGCSARCTLESVCGDGVEEGVEECDDGNAASGDGCNADCTLPRCGDGNVDRQSPFLEQCDEGLNNSNSTSATCSTVCTVNARCGNGKIELGEQCDDENAISGDGCSATCTVEGMCGNGSLESTEECDPNILQSQCGGHSCSSLCICENYCGDGRLGGTEQCDDGNGAIGDGCRPNCTAEVCGDGIKDPSEQCDDGNTNPGDKCSNGCILRAICGDGVLDTGEQCDDGNLIAGDGCNAMCVNEASTCGNNVLEAREQCDDGNLSAGDGCDGTCHLEGGVCGNARLDLGEQCDDGNTNAGDGCDTSCRFEGCGDGVKVIGEQCDDGNRLDFDGCSAQCTIEPILL